MELVYVVLRNYSYGRNSVLSVYRHKEDAITRARHLDEGCGHEIYYVQRMEVR